MHLTPSPLDTAQQLRGSNVPPKLALFDATFERRVRATITAPVFLPDDATGEEALALARMVESAIEPDDDAFDMTGGETLLATVEPSDGYYNDYSPVTVLRGGYIRDERAGAPEEPELWRMWRLARWCTNGNGIWREGSSMPTTVRTWLPEQEVTADAIEQVIDGWSDRIPVRWVGDRMCECGAVAIYEGEGRYWLVLDAMLGGKRPEARGLHKGDTIGPLACIDPERGDVCAYVMTTRWKPDELKRIADADVLAAVGRLPLSKPETTPEADRG